MSECSNVSLSVKTAALEELFLAIGYFRLANCGISVGTLNESWAKSDRAKSALTGTSPSPFTKSELNGNLSSDRGSTLIAPDP